MSNYDAIDAFDAVRVIRELEALRLKGGLRALAIKDASKARARTNESYEQARARVRRATAGTAQAKDDAAVLDEHCSELRERSEDAKIAERYAKDLAAEHESDQSNLQTQSRLIEKILALGGVIR